MDEQAWLASTDLGAMHQFLGDRMGERKLRLFLVGCGRLRWEDLWHPAFVDAIETAERFADGDASSDELRERSAATYNPFRAGERLGAGSTAWNDTWAQAWGVAKAASNPRLMNGLFRRSAAWANTRVFAAQFGPSLLRCIFGNPFRPVAFDPAWRTEAVVALAAGIYADRAFGRLPVLADALEDAGCANPDVLGHCRSDGPHARGCWVVDLVLGKA